MFALGSILILVYALLAVRMPVRTSVEAGRGQMVDGLRNGRLPRGLLRRHRRAQPKGFVDEAMAADLLSAAIAAGASVPASLHALDYALAEEESSPGEGNGLAVMARLLLMGATWEEAWAGAPARFHGVRAALAPAWHAGAAPLPLLERFAHSRRAARVRASREAAAELSARLVLPLGLCFLPAFILVGVVPVIAATGLSLFS